MIPFHSATGRPRIARSSRAARSALAAAALLAIAAAPPAIAAKAATASLTGTLYPALGLSPSTNPDGSVTTWGYIQPYVYVTDTTSTLGNAEASSTAGIATAQFFTGTGTLGSRGLYTTPTASLPLNPLGTNSSGLGNAWAYAVDDAGLVAGASDSWSADGQTGYGTRPVIWGPYQPFATALAMPDGFVDGNGYGYAIANVVSHGGAIAGRGALQTGVPGNRALRWKSATAPAEVLQDPPSAAGSVDYDAASSVNNAGTVVGSAYREDASGNPLGQLAVRWDASATTATVLGGLGTAADGTSVARAVAIDDQGVAVGSVAKYNAAHKAAGDVAVRWDANSTQAVELGNLGHDANGLAATYAVAINAAGIALGDGQAFGPVGDAQGWRAVVWKPGKTKAQPLDMLTQAISGAGYTYAWAINKSGWVAGNANIHMNTSSYYNDPVNLQVHAVVWDPQGHVHDLNDLLPANSGWTLYAAYGIGDTGLVTGVGWYSDPVAGTYQRIFTMQLTSQ